MKINRLILINIDSRKRKVDTNKQTNKKMVLSSFIFPIYQRFLVNGNYCWGLASLFRYKRLKTKKKKNIVGMCTLQN